MEQFQDMRETGLAGLDMCLVLLVLITCHTGDGTRSV